LKVWIPKFNNKRFFRLFLKNIVLVFSGIATLLLVIAVVIYLFANQQLLHEVDAANMRTMETALSTVDAVVKASQGAVVRFAMDINIQTLDAGIEYNRFDYDFIQRVIIALQNMRLSLRQDLDYSMYIYFENTSYVLCTRRGGQFADFHTDLTINDIYRQKREIVPGMRSFTALRQTFFDVHKENELNFLTFYQEISGYVQNASFVALNVNVNAFADYISGTGYTDGSRFVLINNTGSVILDTNWNVAGYHEYVPGYIEPVLDEILHTERGNLTLNIDGNAMRISWLEYPQENWTIIQFVPFDAYRVSMLTLKNFIIIAIIIGLIFSAIIAFIITVRLFKPISDIIRIIDDPESYDTSYDRSGEIKYILMNVLESFQKNIVLEKEMLQKLSVLRDSRAIMLQEQINPHFLYNTLQAINWLAISETSNEESNTSNAIITLAEIIRVSMEQTDNFTTIFEEVEHFKKYMQIAQLRYGEEINYECNVAPGIEYHKILKITLQPLAENAILHGIQPKGGVGNIYVDIAIRDGDLYVCVEDDGEGMDDFALESFNQMLLNKAEDINITGHIGLFNICQRVKLIYGEQYGVKISRSGHGGFKVEVTMGIK